MKGQVYKSTGNWYHVKLSTGEFINARILGIFRLDNLRTTNPIAVGDIVTITLENQDYLITEIEKRENYIIRESPKNRTARHILASNIGQVCIMASLIKPRTSTGFIDRCLVTAAAYNIPAFIVFNKSDLNRSKENQLLEKLISIYKDAAVKTIATSIFDEGSMLRFSTLLSNKSTLLIGHSGVGKSTLINKIDHNLDLKTGEISEVHDKGKHTTTFTEMFDLVMGGSIIDAPGIKEFGLLDIEKYELSRYFPEMMRLLPQCKFNNCLHVSEPDCAILKALQTGIISEVRYQNYLNMLDDMEDSVENWELKK